MTNFCEAKFKLVNIIKRPKIQILANFCAKGSMDFTLKFYQLQLIEQNTKINYNFFLQMSFKIWINQKVFIVSIIEIRINAKFKCQLDIFLKNGSQKEQVFQGLNIQSCKVVLPPQMGSKHAKQIKKKGKSQKSKSQKKYLLFFELRSKTYNAYAGQVELNFSQQQTKRQHSKIQNCIDQQAHIVYEIGPYDKDVSRKTSLVRQNNSSSAPVISVKKPMDKQEENSQIKVQKSAPNSILKKKGGTSVYNQKYKLNFNKQQKSFMTKMRTLPTSIKSSMNNSLAENNFQPLPMSQSQYIFQSKEQQKSEIQVDNTDHKLQIYNSLNNSNNGNLQVKAVKMGKSLPVEQTKKSMKQSVRSFSPQITKKLIQTENKLNQQKQKSLRLQLQVQSRKHELNQVSSKLKSSQKRCLTMQQQLKKAKKLQSTLTKQNQYLKDSSQLLKHKLTQKSQQLHLMSKRNKSYQKNYKEELKTVYQKLEVVAKEKEWKSHEKESLEEHVGRVEKQFEREVEGKNQLLEMERERFEKVSKRLESQLLHTNQSFSKLLAYLSHQVQQLLTKDHYNLQNASKSSLDSSSIFDSSFSQPSQFQLNPEHLSSVRQTLMKVERISVELYDTIRENEETIEKKELEVKGLGEEMRELCMEIEEMRQDNDRERQKFVKQIEQMESSLQQQRLQATKMKKHLSAQITSLQEDLAQLKQTISTRNRQLSSLKLMKEQLESHIIKLQQQLTQKASQYKQSINQLITQKDQLARHFRQQLLQLQHNIQKQRITNNQLTQQNMSLKRNISTLQQQSMKLHQQLLSTQKQLKSAQQTNHQMVKEMTQLKNMISEITGVTSKKEKQMTSQNKELSHQVNSFKENYKALLQAKELIQNQLSKMQAQITSLKEQKAKKDEELKKIEKIFSTTQRSTDSLRNCIMDMKKQNEDLKNKLKKKIEFQQELEDEFQCNFYQIRDKLDYYMRENRQIEKDKAGVERQATARAKKLTAIIQSLTDQLNSLTQYQTYADSQSTALTQLVSDFRKDFEGFEKESMLNSFYGNQLKQRMSTIDKVLEQVSIKYIELQKALVQPRKNRAKNSVSLKRVSTTDNLNKTLIKRNPSVTNNTANDDQNNEPKPSRRLNKNRSMMVSFGGLSKRKDQVMQKAYSQDNIQNMQILKEKQPQQKGLQLIDEENDALISEEEKYRQRKRGTQIKRLSSKVTLLNASSSRNRIQDRRQTLTPTQTKKSALKRLNTLK